jgi:hypothetical protein
MGGGGGGGPFVNRTPEELVRQVRATEDETAIKAFETELGGLLGELLASANSRDVDLVRERLDASKDALAEQLEGTIDTLYGGSVAKHTYVDGLSDVDSLIILNDPSLEGRPPSDVISFVASILRDALGDAATITTGRLAVTLEFKDGMVIQLLPAFRTVEGIRVPSFRHNEWSRIAPEAFEKALSERNAQCGGKLVPTIKLAKAIIGTLPEAQRLSGYHVESLAIAAFRDYTGAKTTQAMLPIFFERARELVLKPIRDRTGQSIHVDEYLGPEGSPERVAAAHVLSRLGKRMRNASAHMSKDQWEALFSSSDA